MRRRVPDERRGGFALVMVVFLLFAVAVAGATGYQVVMSEFALARQNRDSQEALAVARAGLQRYLGETVGVVGDSVSYAIGNGIATVTTRKVLEQDTLNHLYYILSEGQVDDPRMPLLPAKRSVATYAWHRMNPIPLKGAVWVSGGSTTIRNPTFTSLGTTVISGHDSATTVDCPGGGTAGVRGVVKGTGSVSVASGTLTALAPTTSTFAGWTTMVDTVAIRWDILTDAAFPVDFDGSPPSGIESDSFPVVRYRGNLSAGTGWSGRGVLIVTGRLSFPNWSFFTWDGIVLAGELSSVGQYSYPTVKGMLIAGMNSSNPTGNLRGTYHYHSCNAYAANRSLSYLEVVSGTLFEVNG